MMITKLFFLLIWKKFCPKKLGSKTFKPKLRHQVLEAEAVEAEVIQKLLLPHPWYQPSETPQMDLSKNHFLKAKFNKSFKTNKVRNFKFGDKIDLYMKFRTCIFGGAM